MAGHKNIDPSAGKSTQFPHNDPTKGGRPTRITQLEKDLGIKFPKGANYNEIKDLLSRMLFMSPDELKAVSKDKKSPIIVLTIAAGLIKSINSGKLDNLETIISRVHGKPKTTNEHSGLGGGPIELTTPPKINRIINTVQNESDD